MNAKPVLIAALAAVAISGTAAAAERAQAVAGKAGAPAANVTFNGVQVAIDPATGRLRAPTDADRAALAKALLQQQATHAASFSRPATEAEAAATLKRTKSGKMMQVPESQFNYVKAERRPDGSLRVTEGDESIAAQRQEVAK